MDKKVKYKKPRICGAQFKLSAMQNKIIKIELFVFVVLLIICNIHLLKNTFPIETVLLPDKIFTGEWWRLFSNFFTHLSWYHLFVDTSAIFILASCIDKRNINLYLIMITTGSIIFPLLFSKIIYTNGLCGLSGVAHGLMAIAALEMIANKQIKIAGIITFLILIIKITIELTNNYSGDFGIIVKSITLTDKEDQTKQCELIFT